PAQDVVGERTQGQHQVVGVELARRQPFQVKVALEFAVELLAGGMVAVQPMTVSASKASSREVHQPSRVTSGISSAWPFLSMVRSVIRTIRRTLYVGSGSCSPSRGRLRCSS